MQFKISGAAKFVPRGPWSVSRATSRGSRPVARTLLVLLACLVWTGTVASTASHTFRSDSDRLPRSASLARNDIQPPVMSLRGAQRRSNLLRLAAGLPNRGTTADDRPRLLVLTDIGGDPDDQQSLARLMLYANEFEIEGLLASASGTPGELKTRVVQTPLIREIVEAYGQVRDNLALHADGYPTTQYLLDRVKTGNPNRGVGFIGAGHDTEASRWIVAVVDRPDPRPVDITIWGGQTDLAQALWRVREERGRDGLAQFIARIRVHDIADQDGIAEWIRAQFPGLFYVLNMAPAGRDKREAAFRGMYLGGDESLTSRAWIDTHVRTGHGPLGALYPPKTWTAPNPHSALKEGDTPSWFYFLPLGLSDPDHPDWGSWGGRFSLARDRLYRDAGDRVGDVTDARATVWRWRPAFQADFQARMDWCLKPVAQANHPPTPVLNGDRTRNVLEYEIKAGEALRLSAAGSFDPDGDRLSFRWFIYPEAGSYGHAVPIDNPIAATVSLTVPADAADKTIHLVLEVTDNGAPPLTRYRRAVVHARK
ncbi:MAG: DUF1593 domain-containing protein [Planctomycetes bacterium]|nr:DUF1593 domain-containing protein [Planctomycetota bacterium]